MFEKGDYVVYGNKGVCAVTEISTLDMQGASAGRIYYILSPAHLRSSRFFVPIDSEKTVMRAVSTKEEADALIEDIPGIEELWVGNDKMREEQYKQTMKSCECRDWIKIIKTLYLRKQERIAQGKKTTAMDDKYLNMAENNLYSELSVSLGIPKENMGEFIMQHILKTPLTEGA